MEEKGRYGSRGADAVVSPAPFWVLLNVPNLRLFGTQGFERLWIGGYSARKRTGLAALYDGSEEENLSYRLLGTAMRDNDFFAAARFSYELREASLRFGNGVARAEHKGSI